MTDPMRDGRRADSSRRRERVLKALDTLVHSDQEITVSALAGAARVDRTYLYRHRDLLQRVHAAATAPSKEGRATAVSRTSLQADLAHALDRNHRLASPIRQLEKRLSQLLGDAAWAESGLAGAPDIDQLQRRLTMLEQHLADVQGTLEERTEELAAARAANREPNRALNHTKPAPRDHCLHQLPLCGKTDRPGATDVTTGVSTTRSCCSGETDDASSGARRTPSGPSQTARG